MSTATPAPVPESVANEAVEEAGGRPRTGDRQEARFSPLRVRRPPSARSGHRCSPSSWHWPDDADLRPVRHVLFREQKDIQSTGWWNAWRTGFTMGQLQAGAPGRRGPAAADGLFRHNSFVIVIPAVLLPSRRRSRHTPSAWIDSPFRNALFRRRVRAVDRPAPDRPPAVTMFRDLGLGWVVLVALVSHSAFALPLAVFLTCTTSWRSRPRSRRLASTAPATSDLPGVAAAHRPCVGRPSASSSSLGLERPAGRLTMLGGSPELAR